MTEPIDADVDLRVPAQRGEPALPALGAIALGGGLGALARYGLTVALPTPAGHFPLATFLTNVSGCFLIGVLMVLVTEAWTAHRLVRPFLGVGVLGGYTTYSTYAVEIHGLLRPGTVGVAFLYLAGTLVCALFAVLAGVRVTRWIVT
jgi:CrcB protein